MQDRVSLVSSRLWMMLLPSSLLGELADISKLLVSRLQIEKNSSREDVLCQRPALSLQSSSHSGRFHVVEDNDGLEEDWDVSRAPQSEEVDLFDEGSSLHAGSSGSSGQKTDNNNSVCGPGVQEPLILILILIPELG